MSSRNRSSRGGPLPREVQVSKKLSWLLRHGAEKEGLSMTQDGYISMASVLANRNLKSLKVTFEEVRAIVCDNDKQRFNLVPDPARFAPDSHDALTPSDRPEDWCIRANQGHSIKLEAESDLLTVITKDNMPSQAIHGTTRANWKLIIESGGLKPMKRNHVHFAAGLPAGFKSLAADSTDGDKAAPVISGMRSSSTVLLYLDVARALEAGLPLRLSQNGVILSEGNAEGLVPLSLLERVEDRGNQSTLLLHGKLVESDSAS